MSIPCLIIIDYGSQYTQLIARCVREMRVFCEILPFDASAEDLAHCHVSGIILSGGPENAHAENSPQIPQFLIDLSVPILGICYGMQVLALHFGGEVHTAEGGEFGGAKITLDRASELFQGIGDVGDDLAVWMSHGDQVSKLPDGFTHLSSNKNCGITAFENVEKRCYGLQFHPEVTHTDKGEQILRNFVLNICQAVANWETDNIIASLLDSIRSTLAKDHVILALSGGVDSSVLAALLSKAVGKQLTCILIDNGLMRKGEVEQIKEVFSDKHPLFKDMHFFVIDAAKYFLEALKGVSDPEKKRKVIGHVFIDVFQEAAENIEGVQWLAQGTIYPDVIESAASKFGAAHVIKSHHNVGGLPENMQLKLIEPLRELFKDEVREIGLALGLPASLIHRHPFPGPGLSVRILGEVKQEYIDLLREADAIYMEELFSSGYYEKLSQAFAVFLPVKSVGVVGDARRYAHVIALRAVETRDFMTANASRLSYDFLDHVAQRIINEISGISRVVYDISSKPPATIEWE